MKVDQLSSDDPSNSEIMCRSSNMEITLGVETQKWCVSRRHELQLPSLLCPWFDGLITMAPSREPLEQRVSEAACLSSHL